MPCSVAFANAFAGSIRADARTHRARTFATSLPHAAATRGSSQAVSRCTTRHATRGGHRVSNARNRPGPIIGSDARATAHAVSVSVSVSVSWLIGAPRRGRPVRHAAAARRRRAHRRSRRPRRGGRRECGRLGVLGATRGLTAGLPRARGGGARLHRDSRARARRAATRRSRSSPRRRGTLRQRVRSATLAATVAEHSPTGGPMSSSTLGRMIGTRRSNRSTSGPETRRM